MEAGFLESTELKHVRCVSLWSYGTETWLIHDVSGERLSLGEGEWNLHIHPESGFAAVQGVSEGNAGVTWANNLLRLTVYVHADGPSSGQWIQTREGRLTSVSALSEESVCKVLAFSGLHGEEVHVRVYRHRVLTGKCAFAFALSPLVGFMWGSSARQRGWLAKRVGSWQSRCQMLGARVFDLRQSAEGVAVATRQGAVSR
eukprot:6490665-Amphidinium_carterae.4